MQLTLCNQTAAELQVVPRLRLAKLCFCDFEAFTNRLIQTIVSALHCLCTRERERERERERSIYEHHL